MCKCSLPVHGFSFYFFNSVLWREKVFDFNEVQLMSLSAVDCAFGISKKSLPNPRSQR